MGRMKRRRPIHAVSDRHRLQVVGGCVKRIRADVPVGGAATWPVLSIKLEIGPRPLCFSFEQYQILLFVDSLRPFSAPTPTSPSD
jgi:hypothetical protein